MILLNRSTTGSRAPRGRARRRLGAVVLAATITIAPLSVLAAPASAGEVETPAAAEPAPSPEAEPTPEPTPEPAQKPQPEVEEPAAPTNTPRPAEEPEPSPAPEPADEVAQEPSADETRKVEPKKAAVNRAIEHTGVRYEGAGGTVFYVPGTVVEGEPIRVSGTGWQTTAGDAGSVIAFKLDAGAVTTKLEVRHPVTDVVQGNKTIIGIAAADPNGEWEAELPFPTVDNSSAAWSVGQSHGVQLLTGSLTEGDVRRTEVGSFTVAADGDAAATAPTWAHDTVVHTDSSTGQVATAWVENQLAAGTGTKIRVKGTGWTNAARTQGSTIAVKLNSGVGQQYTRAAGQVVEHPTASGDDTIWALLTKGDGVPRPNVHDIDDAGNFEIELDAPANLTAGQYLTMQLQSGKFLAGDVQRSAVSEPLTVGGIPWKDGGAGENVTCTSAAAGPTITIEEPSVELGGRLHVTGTGWCHPAEGRGGSIVAIKIDEGRYSRLDTSVHQNKTIWTLVPADPATGTIDTEIQLPDGSTSGATGSDPAFPEGSHRLRLLTGSLKPGDTVRTLESDAFTVGAYSPNGVPDPLEYTEDLTSATRMGLTVSRGPTALKVTVDGARKGDWVFLSAYGEDGSARLPWGDTWFQADSRGVVTAPLSGATLPGGTSKLVAQSGNRGEVGKLLGWAPLTVKTAPQPEPEADSDPEPVVPPRTATPVRNPAPRVAAAPARLIPVAAPAGVPAAPVPDIYGLTPDNSGGVTGVQDGTIVTLTIPGVDPGDWVYLYAYSTPETTAVKPLPVGWVQTDAARQIKVDVALLAAGDHKLAVLDREGKLIGWSTATVTAEETTAEPEVAPRAPASAGVAKPLAAAKDELLSAADGWLLVAGLLVLLAASASTVWVRHTRPVAEGGQS